SRVVRERRTAAAAQDPEGRAVVLDRLARVGRRTVAGDQGVAGRPGEQEDVGRRPPRRAPVRQLVDARGERGDRRPQRAQLGRVLGDPPACQPPLLRPEADERLDLVELAVPAVRAGVETAEERPLGAAGMTSTSCVAIVASRRAPKPTPKSNPSRSSQADTARASQPAIVSANARTATAGWRNDASPWTTPAAISSARCGEATRR